MGDDDRRLWLALYTVPNLGLIRRNRLILALGGPAAVLSARPGELRRLGLPTALASNLPNWLQRGLAQARLLEQQLDRLGAWLLPLTDPHYPPLLKEIANPPTVLFGVGDRTCLRAARVAVVGTRRATAWGLKTAALFGRELARAGEIVVSGLARGIDGAAHRGALSTGRTVAVLGSGLGVIYPPEHRRLAQQIAAAGAVVTEYLPGAEPLPHQFVMRNRIISGLCEGVVIVEAGMRSGAMRTATAAAEQGRDVFAVVNPVGSSQAGGIAQLLAEGAIACRGPTGVLTVLHTGRAVTAMHAGSAVAAPPTGGAGCVTAAAQGAADAFGSHPSVRSARSTLPLTPAAATVLAAMAADGAVTAAVLAGKTGLTLPTVLSLLLTLEVAGLVAPAPGGRYIRL